MEKTSDVEEKILKAARQEFEQKGYNGTRMQKIAEVAGISKPALHYYFRSKDNLFRMTFDHALEEYLPLANTWANDSLSWEQKIEQFTEDLILFIQKGSMLFIIREINRNPNLLNERIKKSKSQNRFVSYFEQVNANGDIQPNDARLLYIMIHSLCCFPTLNQPMFQKTLRLSEKEYNSLMKDYAKTTARFFINAIKK